MKRKIYYIIPLLLILLGLLVPAIYSNKVNKDKNPPALVGVDTAASVASGDSSEKIAGNVNPDQGGTSVQPASNISTDTMAAKPAGKEGEGQTGNSFLPVPEKSSSTDATSDSKAVTVNVAVLGKNEELLFGPASLTITKKDTGDVTALDVLDATGLPYNISAKWPDFVEAVAGQSNKGQSGWMFKVNGEVPLVACDKKPVTNGDKVIWWYSRNMDIPPPEWDNLLKR